MLSICAPSESMMWSSRKASGISVLTSDGILDLETIKQAELSGKSLVANNYLHHEVSISSRDNCRKSREPSQDLPRSPLDAVAVDGSGQPPKCTCLSATSNGCDDYSAMEDVS
ncbi:hypothetical protein BDZ89DRAFT_546899 [Hymenopellis radicata]|nr:hypothetical protein BDZ89DRAFT_546899 [Hymenopellis radicata]